MCKVRVTLDTSSLRNNAKLSGGPMEALIRYAENGHVEILIPWVVVGEFTTTPPAKIEVLQEHSSNYACTKLKCHKIRVSPDGYLSR